MKFLNLKREDITIHMHLAPELPDCNGDSGQLEQVIMNLAVNAQDAVPNGGELTIETAQTELDEKYAGYWNKALILYKNPSP
ncbi:MAG: hypothetical protein R6X08_11260 [Desulfosalsimonadaceae bacterium]